MPSFNIIENLPNELLYQALTYLNNIDIETLHTIPSIRERIKLLFCVISDISDTRCFKHIAKSYGLKQFISLSYTSLPSETLFDLNRNLLWAIVEINDLQNSAIHLPKISAMIKNRISIYDDYIPATIEADTDTHSQWMQNIKPRTNIVVFENLTKLALADLKLDPALFKFPNLKRLTFTRCESSNTDEYFHLPQLTQLSIEGRFKSLNDSIDFKNASFTHLSLTAISDMAIWCNIQNSSIEQLNIFQGNNMVNFTNLRLNKVKSVRIKDTDIDTISYLTCPILERLHLEQFINSTITIHDLNLPSLHQLHVWVFQLKQFYNINIPSIDMASIMLHNEPIQSQLGDRIDFSSFNRLKTLQICDAGEILAFCNNLEHLEVRGPFAHESLFACHFDHLKSFDIYFNNSLRELPKLIAPSLQKLSISRCTSLKDISNIQHYYPDLKEFHCEYSVLSVINNIDFPTLQTFNYMSSTMRQSISITNCTFPDLIIFEARNLEVRSLNQSQIQLNNAPKLNKLTISNFNMPTLRIENHLELEQLSVNAVVDHLVITNCGNLQRMDLSKNSSLFTLQTSSFPKLISLTCDQTPRIKNFELDTPLLERVEYDEMVRYVKKTPKKIRTR